MTCTHTHTHTHTHRRLGTRAWSVVLDTRSLSCDRHILLCLVLSLCHVSMLQHMLQYNVLCVSCLRTRRYRSATGVPLKAPAERKFEGIKLEPGPNVPTGPVTSLAVCETCFMEECVRHAAGLKTRLPAGVAPHDLSEYMRKLHACIAFPCMPALHAGSAPLDLATTALTLLLRARVILTCLLHVCVCR